MCLCVCERGRELRCDLAAAGWLAGRSLTLDSAILSFTARSQSMASPSGVCGACYTNTPAHFCVPKNSNVHLSCERTVNAIACARVTSDRFHLALVWVAGNSLFFFIFFFHSIKDFCGLRFFPLLSFEKGQSSTRTNNKDLRVRRRKETSVCWFACVHVCV